jgi:hypothetical protein
MAEAISLAEEMKDTYSLAVMLGFAANLEIAERNLAEVERYSSDLIEFVNALPFCAFSSGRIDSTRLGAQRFR